LLEERRLLKQLQIHWIQKCKQLQKRQKRQLWELLWEPQLEREQERLRELERRLRELERRLLEQRLRLLEQRLRLMEQRLRLLERRLEQLPLSFG
jgi:hypothetical protein